VTLGIVVCEVNLYKKLKKDRNLPVIGKDSKKLKPEEREKYHNYLKIKFRRKKKNIEILTMLLMRLKINSLHSRLKKPNKKLTWKALQRRLQVRLV
jgi:ribonuclease HII